MALLAAHCILQSACHVLRVAGRGLGFAFSLQLLVAGDRRFLRGTLGLLYRTLVSIFIRCRLRNDLPL